LENSTARALKKCKKSHWKIYSTVIGATTGKSFQNKRIVFAKSTRACLENQTGKDFLKSTGDSLENLRDSHFKIYGKDIGNCTLKSLENMPESHCKFFGTLDG